MAMYCVNLTQPTINATRDASEPGDIVTGTVLLLCCAFGVPANLVSLGYFYTRKALKTNK